MQSLALQLCVLLPGQVTSHSVELRPVPHNVVVIVGDDVGVDLVHAYEPFYGPPPAGLANHTPVLDSIAGSGILFRNFWTSPVCSPTRAQVLTGRNPARSGLGWITNYNCPAVNGTGLDPAIDTIPGMLRSGPSLWNYHTAAIGKWHLADQCQLNAGLLHPLGSATRPWFHQYAGSLFNFVGVLHYTHWMKTFATPIDPGFDDCTPTPGAMCTTFVTQYATADTTDDAIHILRTMPEPFFLYVAYNAIHLPLTPPPAPGLTPAACAGGAVAGLTPCAWVFDPKLQTRCMMQWLDNEIGRLFCAIEDSAHAPEHPTTVIFLGDNGNTAAGTAAPFDPTHGKATLFDGGINTPLIVTSPLIPPHLRGSASTALVSATDVFATVGELTFSTPPPDPHSLRDSVSFVPSLVGAVHRQRDVVYSESFAKNFTPTPQGAPPHGYSVPQHSRVIRDRAGFKLHQTVTKNTVTGLLEFEEHLFDLSVDPFESNDLIQLPASSAIAAKLRSLLAARYPILVQ